MSFSFRRKPDLEAAQQRIDAEFAKQVDIARRAKQPEFVPPVYVRPDALYAFRLSHRLSVKAAGALLARSDTWWSWREHGYWLMPPDLFERAKLAAAKLAPKGAEPEPVTKAGLHARLRQLEARVAALEAGGCDLL